MQSDRNSSGAFLAGLVGLILLLFLIWFFIFRTPEAEAPAPTYDDSSLRGKIAALEDTVNSLPKSVEDLIIEKVNELLGNQPTAKDGEPGSPGPAGSDGATGADGADGADGATGAQGPPGPQGPQGPSGTANCPNGDCLSLQPTSPGVQETGNVNVSGTIIAGNFSGDGSQLTDLDAANISSGTLDDARLSGNVSLLGASIQDAEVDDNLTISGGGSVDWVALTNYPAGCGAGQAITTLGDSITCTAFAGSSDITLQNAYANGNVITTSDARDVTITLANTATDSNFVINVASGSTGAFKVQNNGVDFFNVSPSATFGLDLVDTTKAARIASAELGTWPANSAFAYFGHEALDHSNVGNYALLQSVVGDTYLNAATGRQILFRINNNTIAALNTVELLSFVDIRVNRSVNATAGVTAQNTANTAGALAGFSATAADSNGYLLAAPSGYTVLPALADRLSLYAEFTTTGLNLVANGAGGDIRMFTGGNALGNERLRIDNTGRVGIGDTSPSVRLSLGGTGAANGIVLGDDAANSVNLYHNGANELRTDDTLIVSGAFNVANGLVVTGFSGATVEITFGSNIRGKNEIVTAAATTLAITGKSYADASYAVLCTPNWNTTCWATGKTATGFTLNFGTAAPGGATVDWIVIR